MWAGTKYGIIIVFTRGRVCEAMKERLTRGRHFKLLLIIWIFRTDMCRLELNLSALRIPHLAAA